MPSVSTALMFLELSIILKPDLGLFTNFGSGAVLVKTVVIVTLPALSLLAVNTVWVPLEIWGRFLVILTFFWELSALEDIGTTY